MDKKGNIDDIWVAIGFLLTLAVIMLFSSYIFDAFNTKFQAVSTDAHASDIMNTYNTKLPKAYDYGFALLLAGFIIFSMVMAKSIPSSPIFYGFAIFIFVFIWFASILISFIFNKMVNANANILAFVANLPIINFIMPRMIFYAIIYSVLVALALYTKDN